MIEEQDQLRSPAPYPLPVPQAVIPVVQPRLRLQTLQAAVKGPMEESEVAEKIATMRMQMKRALAEESGNNLNEKQTSAIDNFDQTMQSVWKVAEKI
jgi:hypothetical protein